MPNILPIHPFPARMAPEIALAEINSLPMNSTILDPMMGSGTVLRAAIINGRHAIGRDLDPLAVLMSRVWITPVDIELLKSAALEVAAYAQELKEDELEISWIDNDPETKKFIEFWFAKTQEADLRRLIKSILASENSVAVKNALKLAVSRIIITKNSGASLARDTSHSRPHRVSLTNDFSVMVGFAQSVSRLSKRLSASTISADCDVDSGDARHLESVPDSSVDAIITSPPYLNAIDYMRGHRLALVWLGYRLNDLRQVKSTSIGIERSVDTRSDVSFAQGILVHIDRDSQLPKRQQSMVERYILDLHAMISEAKRVLKPDGRAVFVVGNSNVKGVFVSNSTALQKIAEQVGLSCVSSRERDLPPNRRYLPPPTEKNTSSLTKRMRTESVLTFVRR